MMILFNAGVVLALLVTYLSVFVSPADFWILAFFGLAYPYILLINILFVIFWLLTRWKLSFFSLLAILSGTNHLQNYFQLGEKTSVREGVSICSYNVKHFFGMTPGVEGKKIEEQIAEYLRSKNADIICLQEMNASSMEDFNPFPDIRGEKKISVNATRLTQHTGPVVFTRHTILNSEEISFDDSENRIVFADIKIDSDTLRIYSCHLQSYRLNRTDFHSLESLSIDYQNKGFQNLRQLGIKFKEAFIKRTAHAKALNNNIRQSPYPVVVCGDFNDSPVSYTYRTVRGQLNDAFVESGSGTGNTYAGHLPSFRIDYILHSKIFLARNFKIDRVPYSDHYPVNCTLLRSEKQ